MGTPNRRKIVPDTVKCGAAFIISLKFLWISMFVVSLFPVSAFGQTLGDLKDARVILLTVNSLNLTFKPPPPAASNEVRGYTDVLNEEFKSNSVSLGLFLKDLPFLFEFGLEEGDAELNKFADVNQTPGDATDDVFVFTARRRITTLSVKFLFYFLLVGINRIEGEVEFSQNSSGGNPEVKVLSFDNILISFDFFLGHSDEHFGLFINYKTLHPVFDRDFKADAKGFGITLFADLKFD